MRCLNCGQDALPINTEICPRCSVYLPALMRDLLAPGYLLNRYRIDYPLGRGGFGVTYRAIHTKLEQPVAIKEFYPTAQAVRNGKTSQLAIPSNFQANFDKGLRRFLREARILNNIEHPNIIRIRDYFEENNTAYIVMSLISGKALASIIKEEPNNCLAPERVKEIIEPLINALETIHAASIYHLDIKPDNILLSNKGKLILVDFGASKQGMGNESTQAFTMSYAPPELISGEQIGAYTDIYSLGVTIYQMLTGKLPPNALTRIYKDDWQASDLEQPWRNLVENAMKMNAANRPKNITSWWESAFDREQNEPIAILNPVQPQNINNNKSSELPEYNSDNAIDKPIKRRRLLEFAGFGAIGLGFAVFINQQRESTNINEKPQTPPREENPPPTAANVSLLGAGASFPARLYQKWFSEYNKKFPNIEIAYQSVGSGAGVEQFTREITDFGASDYAMTDEEIARVSRGVQLLPMTAGSIVVAYNIPGLRTGLRLTREAYVDIFLGNITKWNDPKIAAANPFVSLPDLDIFVIHRSDGSGTTGVFTKHLSAISFEWKQEVGEGKTVQWQVGVGAKGNEGVTAQIKQTEGAIGYVEFSYASNQNLPLASLENRSGNFIAPTLESASQTLAAVELPENLRAFITDPAGNRSYPIVYYTWILAYKRYEDEDKLKALKGVLKWGLNDGQEIARNLGYVPLPANIVNKVEAALNEISSS